MLKNMILMILERTSRCLDSLIHILENLKISRITTNNYQHQIKKRKQTFTKLTVTTLLNNKIHTQNKLISDEKIHES